MTHFASEVLLLVRRDQLRASKAMQEKVFKNEKIQILWNTEATELVGEKLLSGVWTINNKTQEKVLIECAGVFYAIGHTPNTAFLG